MDVGRVALFEPLFMVLKPILKAAQNQNTFPVPVFDLFMAWFRCCSWCPATCPTGLSLRLCGI